MQDVMALRLDALFAVSDFVANRSRLEHGMQTLAVYTGAGSLFTGKEGGEQILRGIGASGDSAQPEKSQVTVGKDGKTTWNDDGDKIAAIGMRMGKRARK